MTSYAVEGFMPPCFKIGKDFACSPPHSIGDSDAEQSFEGWVQGDVALIHNLAVFAAHKFQLGVALSHAVEECAVSFFVLA
ncbi:protein of unknown function [Methylorubrum extorquens]|uniref:Uncharacterized protein n=1 Tax=Methylorubrum extorquens TaxID=408 RepID=A0A2N9AN54_METEX|nr:hypothetical protein ASF36_18980 [Methylobacterium sp. Leaf90]SOR28797.1 protein of unknown function [Methylorubrum extorquens]